MNYSGRQRLLERQLEHLRLDGLLIRHLANVRYLCAFAGSCGVLAFADGSWAFFTDGRYIEQDKMQVKSTVVGSGRNSALPHARPGGTRIGHGFVVLDYGVILSGYCSDMTRTVRVGPANEKVRRIYSAVLEAQLAGIAAVRAGVEGHAVDDAA